MIQYPSVLPGPLLSGHALNKTPNILRTEMDSGQSRVRRRFKSVPTIIPSTWLFTADDAADFETFIEGALSGGLGWFELQIKSPSGVEYKQVRFITSPLDDCKATSINLWEYKAQIEMKNRPLESEERLVNRLLSPHTFTEFVEGIDMSIYYEN